MREQYDMYINKNRLSLTIEVDKDINFANFINSIVALSKVKKILEFSYKEAYEFRNYFESPLENKQHRNNTRKKT